MEAAERAKERYGVDPPPLDVSLGTSEVVTRVSHQTFFFRAERAAERAKAAKVERGAERAERAVERGQEAPLEAGEVDAAVVGEAAAARRKLGQGACGAFLCRYSVRVWKGGSCGTGL